MQLQYRLSAVINAQVLVAYTGGRFHHEAERARRGGFEAAPP